MPRTKKSKMKELCEKALRYEGVKTRRIVRMDAKMDAARAAATARRAANRASIVPPAAGVRRARAVYVCVLRSRVRLRVLRARRRCALCAVLCCALFVQLGGAGLAGRAARWAAARGLAGTVEMLGCALVRLV